tara:strand:+ start:1225 stop:1746 length:522 start_codon:yes stop_codon:yes gene_type:complete
MSSLIMGRQRRGKNELSTLVDPATIVGPEQIYPLGYEAYVPAGSTNGNGPQTWVYVKVPNGTPAFMVMSRTNATLFEVSSAGPAEQINTPVGASQSAIPANHFGFILRNGVGKLTAATGISIVYNESVIMAASGEVTTHAGVVATDSGFGFAVTAVTSGADPVEFTAYVNFLG